MGKRTARLIYGNKAQTSKTSSTEYAKQEREISFVLRHKQTCSTGSTLYQIQGGKLKLIAYASKRFPEAAKNYSITELELCGLAINIASFAHLFKRVDLDAIVDHLSLTHIIKSKAELATTRIKRLLELISSYSFNLYYMKGRDMIVSDFLS